MTAAIVSEHVRGDVFWSRVGGAEGDLGSVQEAYVQSVSTRSLDDHDGESDANAMQVWAVEIERRGDQADREERWSP